MAPRDMIPGPVMSLKEKGCLFANEEETLGRKPPL